MPQKATSSVRASVQSFSNRPRTPGIDANDNIRVTASQLSSIAGGSQNAPISAEEIRRMRAILNGMGYKQVTPNEPLTNEQTLANMVWA
jgi:hypothetical protein